MAAERVTTFKIFVGNVPEGTSNEEIRQIFEEFGTVVECDCVGTKAFVHMEDDIEGKHALAELQGRELNGNLLKIEESKRKRQELPKLPTVKLLVRNVSTNIDARGLRNLFKRFGFVVEVLLENGEGHVCLEATGDIGSAIKEMNGYMLDEVALEVEPAPQHASTEQTSKSQRNDRFNSPHKNRGNGRERDNSWGNAYQYNDQYYEDNYQEDYQDDYGYNEPSPWEFNGPPMQSFRPPPERILRDPHSRPRVPNMHPRFPGPPPFRGAPNPFMMGPRGPRGGPRMFPPRPIVNYGMPPRGPPMRIPRNSRDHHFQQHTNPFEVAAFQQQQQEEEVPFYEDEPIVAVPRDLPRRSLSGANCVPIGSESSSSSFGMVSDKVRRNGKRGGRKPWKGPPAKFTAVTHDVAPGEKYPVPPVNNPVFRAPLKWPKEQVKRKVKRKKKPLVPAELPDYSLPVPELPRQSIPQGAVLKPFPPPASSNYNQQDDHANNSNNSQIDFTSDDY